MTKDLRKILFNSNLWLFQTLSLENMIFKFYFNDNSFSSKVSVRHVENLCGRISTTDGR
jgi:hypothetical protein